MLRRGSFLTPIQHVYKGLVKNGVGRGNGPVFPRAVGRALKGGHEPSGLLDKEDSGGRVPRVEVLLPESVQAAGGHEAQVECSGSGPPNTTRSKDQVPKAAQDRIRLAANSVGEARAEQGVVQDLGLGHLEARAAKIGAPSLNLSLIHI